MNRETNRLHRIKQEATYEIERQRLKTWAGSWHNGRSLDKPIKSSLYFQRQEDLFFTSYFR